MKNYLLLSESIEDANFGKLFLLQYVLTAIQWVFIASSQHPVNYPAWVSTNSRALEGGSSLSTAKVIHPNKKSENVFRNWRIQLRRFAHKWILILNHEASESVSSTHIYDSKDPLLQCRVVVAPNEHSLLKKTSFFD